jgi:hypothetical protein
MVRRKGTTTNQSEESHQRRKSDVHNFLVAGRSQYYERVCKGNAVPIAV